jgi:hypothetical protein
VKTDELIIALSRQAEDVDAGTPARRLLAASLLGIAGAAPLLLWWLGVNPHLASDAQTPMFWVKWVFVAAVAAAGATLVSRLARPGAAIRGAVQAVAVPFVALWGLAAVVLLGAARPERMPLTMGSSWSTCPFSIALLSLPALVLLLMAVRSLAPTRLRRAGAAAGLLAGALGALVYVLHCPELEAPFLAVWDVLGMLIPAGVGALVGPRALRW